MVFDDLLCSCYTKKMNTRGSRYNFGFTIVELLVVIVVIGILAAITIVSYSGITNRATISSLHSDLANASTTLKLDYIPNGAFPATLALANGGKGITQSQSLDGIIYVPDNTSNPNNFCLEYRKGTNTYAIDNSSSVSNGVCLKNLVTNGDFSNGVVSWGSDYGSVSAANNILTAVQTFQYGMGNAYTMSPTKIIGHKYYGHCFARVLFNDSTFLRYKLYTQILNVIANPVQNQWYELSFVGTADNVLPYDGVEAGASGAAGTREFQLKYFIEIDLTAAFGAGNEPTKAQMDTIMGNYLNSWFNIVSKVNS